MSSQKPDLENTSNQRKDFNYYITKFFLSNNRLTILSLFLLVTVGVSSVFLLKTTGFPSPEIKIAVVNTIYPGASSETIVKEITQPLEAAIKDVDGVSRYSSNSSNSVSTISVSINQNANSDSVKNKIDSAVKSVKLPEGVETPTLFSPDIGGPDYIFSVAGNDKAKIYNVYQTLQKEFLKLPETASVTPTVELEKQIVITLDQAKLAKNGITVNQIQQKLQSAGETIPVISGVSLDNQSTSILTSIKGQNLEYIQNLEFTPAQPSGAPVSGIPSQPVPLSAPILLKDLGNFETRYEFVKGINTVYSFNKDNSSVVKPAIVFNIKSAKDVDQGAYNKKLEEIIKKQDNIVFAKSGDVAAKYDSSKVLVAENLSVSESNKEQVDEVIGGLIGSPLKIDGPASNLGWLLGGVQLVMLVMIAFVSWRAAIIAGISIPLSLAFSTIYLYLIGENLNTLVLFSLVLVIGLVVDPALVMMEAVQRKIDGGLVGKEAVLEAVRDVGPGVFMASLTNIIVFLPFGVMSGILGAIFAYIPLTIVPATIGSYVVPLVFLAWMGGLILKPAKNAKGTEEENMWPIARWLEKINLQILNGARWIRLVIILLGLIVPITISYLLVSSEQIKVVQFASNDNGKQIQISGAFLPVSTTEERSKITAEILSIATENKDVLDTAPFGNGFSYVLNLKPTNQRSQISVKIAEDINLKLQEKVGNKMFDLKTDVIQNGPAGSGYQVSVAVKTDDLDKLKTSSLEVARIINQSCKLKDNSIVIDEKCQDGEKIITKVDDGYTNKNNRVIDIVLNQKVLSDNALILPNAPATILVNNAVKSQFQIGDGKEVTKIRVDGKDLGVYLDKIQSDPISLEALKESNIAGLNGKSNKLSDISTVTESFPKTSIQRSRGQTLNIVQARLNSKNADNQRVSAQIVTAVKNYFAENDYKKTTDLGLEKDTITEFSDGSTAEFAKSFQELLVALVLAIFVSYLVLALFFKSLSQPLAIIYTIPLTLLGVFPGLAYFASGQIGFLEIIGIIILVGIVENVAIFLIDAANTKIREEGWNDKEAIAFASGLRFRPVILTKLTALASLAPLAIFSVFYRSIAVTIIFGILASGFISLITTPILFVFFRWMSKQFMKAKWYNKVLFLTVILAPIYLIVWGIKDKPVLQDSPHVHV
jgi:HAE1 family hydrophobic/amphiphilic exporter-1